MKRGKLKRKSKSELTRLKDQLWQLCRQIVKLQHPHLCFTCGKRLIAGEQGFHTGHFISSSICSTELRYHLDNLRPQCSGCNVWKSGNWLEFEKHLTKENGNNYVSELKELNNKTKGLKYGSWWYLDKISHYQEIIEMYK